ncbi:hypothetical protein CVCC1112_4119 [Paenarthrobacter nicotinovorans]|nr:hypothetical protein CVCC1112_4119 [Paenarthrobacter nicotinovorans]
MTSSAVPTGTPVHSRYTVWHVISAKFQSSDGRDMHSLS